MFRKDQEDHDMDRKRAEATLHCARSFREQGPSTSITVNTNIKAQRHIDANNTGQSYIMRPNAKMGLGSAKLMTCNLSHASKTENMFTSLVGYDLRWNKPRYFSLLLIGGDDVL